MNALVSNEIRFLALRDRACWSPKRFPFGNNQGGTADCLFVPEAVCLGDFFLRSDRNDQNQ